MYLVFNLAHAEIQSLRLLVPSTKYTNPNCWQFSTKERTNNLHPIHTNEMRRDVSQNKIEYLNCYLRLGFAILVYKGSVRIVKYFILIQCSSPIREAP